MSWLNPFKNPYRGALFSAPGSCTRRCAKCDGHSTGMRYDKMRNLLEYRCHTCGYEWTGLTADSKHRDAEALMHGQNKS